MLIVPSVTMKGGRPTRATRVPLINPMPTPISSPTRIARGTGRPSCMQRAETRPAKAIVAPTDRSMPPMMITRLSPSDTMASQEKFRDRLARLLRVRKVSVRRPRKARTAMNSTRTTNTWWLIRCARLAWPPGQWRGVCPTAGLQRRGRPSSDALLPGMIHSKPCGYITSKSSIICRTVAASRSFLSTKAVAPASMPSRRNSRSG